MTLKVGAYNGQGESLNDVNNKKSFGARATAALTSKIDVGASWFSHDGIMTVNDVPAPASPHAASRAAPTSAPHCRHTLGRPA